MPNPNQNNAEATGAHIAFTAKVEPAEILAAANGTLPHFDVLVYTGGFMELENWPYPVIVDLGGLQIPTQQIPVRGVHKDEMERGIGHTEWVKIENGSVRARVVVSRETEAAREVVASARNGFPWQASIGANPLAKTMIAPGQTMVVNGIQCKGPCINITSSVLEEISFVDLGADARTEARLAAQKKESTTMADEVVKTEEVQKVEAARKDPISQDDTLSVQINEAKRKEKIRASAVKAGDGCDSDTLIKIQAVMESAIKEGWGPDKAERELVQASRPNTPHIQDHRWVSEVPAAEIVEASLAMAGGMPKVEAKYAAKTLEAAKAMWPQDIGLQEALEFVAARNGAPHIRARHNLRETLEYAFPRNRVRASFSSINISGILSNVANKFILEGFNMVESTWSRISGRRSMRDFKTGTSYRLTGDAKYELVAPQGEIKHGTLEEESYTNKVNTYAKQFQVDRVDIINDDMGSMSRIPTNLGRGAALKLNDVFWTIFLGNGTGTFFAAAHANYITGIHGLLDIDGLRLAEITFNAQLDDQGNPIGVDPVIMLVPSDLNADAIELTSSRELRNMSVAVGGYGTSNPFAGRFRVEMSRYLNNINFPGYAANTWYLLAPPAVLPVIEVAFLNGKESPTIETADADFDVLGIRMRGYHDFGVALQDYRGGVMMEYIDGTGT